MGNVKHSCAIEALHSFEHRFYIGFLVILFLKQLSFTILRLLPRYVKFFRRPRETSDLLLLLFAEILLLLEILIALIKQLFCLLIAFREQLFSISKGFLILFTLNEEFFVLLGDFRELFRLVVIMF